VTGSAEVGLWNAWIADIPRGLRGLQSFAAPVPSSLKSFEEGVRAACSARTEPLNLIFYNNIGYPPSPK